MACQRSTASWTILLKRVPQRVHKPQSRSHAKGARHHTHWRNHKLKAHTFSTHNRILTPRRNFHEDPTSTPGIGPKWFGFTMLHVFCRPAHAIPCEKVTTNNAFRPIRLRFSERYSFQSRCNAPRQTVRLWTQKVHNIPPWYALQAEHEHDCSALARAYLSPVALRAGIGGWHLGFLLALLQLLSGFHHLRLVVLTQRTEPGNQVKENTCTRCVESWRQVRMPRGLQ